MYRVYIIDDESWVIESLKKGIDWARYGFIVAGSSSNGRQALAEIGKLVPDVVMVDIRMPQMSGFEIIQEVRRQNLPIEFIVVSGYAEFAYAQKALRYGVLGYCVKPVEEEEVGAVLARVKAALDRKRVADDAVDDEIVGIAEFRNADDFERRLRNAGFDFNGRHDYRALALRGAQELLSFRYTPSYTCPVGIDHRIWFLRDDHYQQEKRTITSRLISEAQILGASREFQTSAQIGSAVQDAIIACHQYFMHATPGIYEYPEIPDTLKLREAIHVLEGVIGNGEREKLGAAFDNLSAVLSSGYTAKHACFGYNAIHYILASHGVDDKEPVYHFEELLGTYSDVGFMLESLRQTVDDLLAAKIDATAPDRAEATGSAAEKAVRYIDAHFIEPVSLRSLAQRFFVNPSHLSRSFKQITGESLTSYVAKKRIGYACETLSSSELPVAEIAEKSGYDNYFYFARVFKRVMGETPTAYREKRE